MLEQPSHGRRRDFLAAEGTLETPAHVDSAGVVNGGRFSQKIRRQVLYSYLLTCSGGAFVPCCACRLWRESGGDLCLGKQKEFATQSSPWIHTRLD